MDTPGTGLPDSQEERGTLIQSMAKTAAKRAVVQLIKGDTPNKNIIPECLVDKHRAGPSKKSLDEVSEFRSSFLLYIDQYRQGIENLHAEIIEEHYQCEHARHRLSLLMGKEE